jgi:hypothetical protein
LAAQPRPITLRGLRIIWRALLFATVLYVWVTERFHYRGKTINPGLYTAICVLSISLIVSIFRLRKRLVKQLQKWSNTMEPSALRRAYAFQIMLMACSFAEIVYGVLVRFLGATLAQTLPFYILGFLLLLYFKPKEIDAGANT